MRNIIDIFCLLVFLQNFYNSIELEIDAEHLDLEPNCGNMPKHGGSRMSNSKSSTQKFPWEIQVNRLLKNKNGGGEILDICGANIITQL